MSNSDTQEAPGCWSTAGVGCLTFVAGAFSGGMVGVFASVMVRELTQGPTCEGIPTCDWHIYMFVGALIGALSLPALALRRIRRAGRTDNHSDRG